MRRILTLTKSKKAHVSDLFAAKYHWYHALRFSGLGRLVNQHSAEPELG